MFGAWLLASSVASAQYPYFAGNGPYVLPSAQLNTAGPAYWSSYSYNELSPSPPKHQVVVPGKGVFWVRDSRDVISLEKNLGVKLFQPAAQAGQPQNAQAKPQVPQAGNCPGGICPRVNLFWGGQPVGAIKNFGP
jgi:hypothetical protein